MNKGFTIIELSITIFILSIAVIGIYSAFSIMLILTTDTADRLVASYLAQEGAEIIRNIRDSNWIANSSTGNSWDYGLSICQNGLSCQVDYSTASSYVLSWNGGDAGGDYLGLDPNGFYSYRGGEQTKFRRRITIDCLPYGDCGSSHIMKAAVEVFWDEKPNILRPEGGTGVIEVQDVLYNWY